MGMEMFKSGVMLECVVVILLCMPIVFCESRQTAYPWGNVRSGEYCDFESFEATCAPDEIIVIGSATYGHMALGRCVEFDTGHLGCQSDVYEILDNLCSGKRSCSIRTDDEAFRATSPCRRGVMVYLQASYSCVKALQNRNLCSPLTASTQIEYVSSAQARTAPCTKATGVYNQEFTVTAQPGQKITFSLINLSLLLNMQPSVYSSGQELGYILDSQSDVIDPITVADVTESEIAVSRSHQASIFLSSNPPLPFLIGFRVTGCPDLRLSSDVLLHRDGDKTTVSCHKSAQTWELHCRGNQWIGVIGNCTIASPVVAQMKDNTKEEWGLPLPRDIILVIIGCATFFIAVLVVTVGYVCLKWPNEKRRQVAKATTLRRPEIKHMRLHSTGGSDIVYLTPRYSPEGEGDPMSNSDYQPIWEMPLPRPPNNEQTTNPRPAPKRNNEDTYNMSLSSNSTDYERKKYFVLDKDFVNNTMGATALA